jgi:hypothetical protein
VVPLPPVDQTPPTISGTMTAGQTLTLAHGTWTNSPTAYTEQWEDCDASGAGCAPIGGATGTSYTLTGDDVGHTVRVSESASNAGGPSQQPAVSAATAPVAPAPTKPVAPANTAAPVVSGVAAVGQALTATVGQWSGTGPISYAEQWQRCTPACAGIPGATGPSYVIASGDVGAYLRVVVTAMNSAGSSEAASGQVGPVPAIQPSRAAIRGALAAALAPNGAAARLASLLKHRGYTFRFRAPSAGRLVIGWYLVPRGAHLARARPVLVATARAVVPGPGTRRYALRLTVAGRRLLARRARVPLTGAGTFTPNGGGPVSVVKRFTLRR